MRTFPTHSANQAELAAFPPAREPLQWDSARLAVTSLGTSYSAQARCPHGVRICQMHLCTCCRKLGINYIFENYICNWNHVFKNIQIFSKCSFVLNNVTGNVQACICVGRVLFTVMPTFACTLSCMHFAWEFWKQF